jgi:glycosyltransferase involved in cell wall biosynthesis
VDDPRPWFAAADVVAVPSRWEGMAFVPLEAMAAGRSVVAFAATGIPESVPTEAGAVVPIGDRGALAQRLVERLDDPAGADREGVAGRRHVERHHDVALLADRMMAIYRDVLTERSAGPRPVGGGGSSPSSC